MMGWGPVERPRREGVAWPGIVAGGRLEGCSLGDPTGPQLGRLERPRLPSRVGIPAEGWKRWTLDGCPGVGVEGSGSSSGACFLFRGRTRGGFWGRLGRNGGKARFRRVPGSPFGADSLPSPFYFFFFFFF